MRFKTDENVHPEVADLLRERGHDALTIWDQKLRGHPDVRIAEVCLQEKRTLVTFDIGFGDIRTYPPERFEGIIVLGLSSQSRAHVLRVIGHLLPILAEQPIAGRLWIVDEHRVRIRPQNGKVQ